ncbi:hypothetical protein ACIBI8_14680 [Streptomyces sp. NPDC050529]|uniref:hypothetical protein n=1 Tax=unclassified Streptomyces TaxID=2593676 RepID=UPI002DDAD867|nr:hypothetical protein [Streptomyces sp. NBC_01022]WRZ85218.1 hypothetical protein OG316_35610 [Streptomyces sp. NBC_01022]
MNDWYPLVRATVAHPGVPQFGGVLELFADVDPALPVVPGQEIGLGLSLTPAGGAYRTYGYLLDDLLGDIATMPRHPGMSHLENGRFATYVSGVEPRVLNCLVRVNDDAPEGAVLLPRVSIGLMLSQGDKLVSSAILSDNGFRVRRHTVPGQSMVLRQGGRAVLPAGHTPVAGLRLVGVGLARHGVLTCGADGSVVYEAEPSHVGHDSFELCYEDVRGYRTWSEVAIQIGEFGSSPGPVPTYN